MRYSGDFKLSLVKYLLINYLSLSQASTKYHITDTLILKWKKEYEKYGVSALYEVKPRGRPAKMKEKKPTSKNQKTPSDPYQELLDENLRLRIENEYLK